MSRTKVERGPRRGAGLRARLLAALLALAVLPSLAGAQSVEDKYRMQRERMSRFNLAAGPTTVLAVNQWQCGLNSEGDTCTDVFDSPTGGGGFWPTGSPNQYMFNSGIQVVGIIPADAGFEWAGDTVGAFFMDASGNYAHGTAITDIYNSLDAADVENWPTPGSIPDFPFLSGIIDDTSMFNPVLIGRKSASQQDSWVAYWDGDPAKTGGRTHPMGIVVEQRTMAWNYPEGAESVIFLIYKFTNATNNPTFQQINETRYGIQLPDGGWTFDSLYVAYDSDPDVGATATNNYATGILPFNLGLAYEGPFYDPNFIYPSTLFHAPFFPNAPGIVAMKYLKSPVNPATGEEVGLTSLSQHTNGGAFPDPNTVERGWRYISLNTDAGKGDPSCNVTVPLACYLANTVSDVRLFIGSGPFSLGPGESSTIAVAMYAAATVATPLITVAPDADNKPGIPALAPGCGSDPIRAIEIASGYIGPRAGTCPDETGEERLSQYDIEVVPNSLLGRGMVAQAIFDNKFLLGFAPEAPPFYLVPGDNRVTVVWQPSATEVNGDPFIEAARDSITLDAEGQPVVNTLYDPNYREFDVEGYRIYRGTSPANLQLIAQFDKAGTVFTDVTCITDPLHVTTEPCLEIHEVDISSPFIQYTTVSELASGDPIIISADTALNNLISQVPPLAETMTNTGIPFAYVDNDVRNGFQYHYKVTAFDINSVRSTPSSLESAAGTKSTIPRTQPGTVAANVDVGLFGRGELLVIGDNPAIDPATGTFSGPQQPTDLLTGTFNAFAGQLLSLGARQIVIDSVIPGYYPNAMVARYHLTVDGTPLAVEFSQCNVQTGSCGVRQTVELDLILFAADPASRQALIDLGVDAPPLAASFGGTLSTDRPHWASGMADWAPKQPAFWAPSSVDPPAALFAGGSRWFTGDNETMPDPTYGVDRHGELPGTTIFQPAPYRGLATPNADATAAAGGMTTYVGIGGSIAGDVFRRFGGTTLGVMRAADMKFYWGAAGLDSVIDVTHNVPVTFHTLTRATYGFLQDSDGNGTLTWGDFLYNPGLQSTLTGGTNELSPLIAANPVGYVEQPVVLPTDVTGDHVAEGDGFGLYIAGEPFLFAGPVPTNTVWTLRTYHGGVTRTNGVYAFTQTPRNPAIPGLALGVQVNSATEIVAAEANLEDVHTLPDPYYAVSQFDRGPQAKELQFVNLPDEATIRIYSMSGVLVDIVNHSDPTGGGIATWDLRNRSNQFVASGVYFFHLSTPDGREHVGKFTVVNAGFGR